MNSEYSQCKDCGGTLVRIKYAQSYECPECVTLERDSLYLKLERIELQVIKWVDKQGHNKCHNYPDIFQTILNILEIDYDITKNNVSEKEFKKVQQELFKAE